MFSYKFAQIRASNGPAPRPRDVSAMMAKSRAYQAGWTKEIWWVALQIVADFNGLTAEDCALASGTCAGPVEIDHSNGSGNQDRKESGGAYVVYRQIVDGERDEVLDMFRPLCRHHNR